MLRVFGWADSINERDEADGGGLGRLDQSAAGGHDREGRLTSLWNTTTGNEITRDWRNKIIEPEIGSAEEGEVNYRDAA